MNVLQNLVELYNQLPQGSTYRIVVKGILDHLSEAADATIYDLAEMTDSSRTTIWRMLQKMGYENYSDFRHALKKEVGQYTYYNRILQADEDTDLDDILSRAITQTKNIRSTMEKHFHTKDISAIADIVYEKQEILFYFPYHCYSINSFQQNLAMAGKSTGYFCLYPDMLESNRHADKDTLIFIDTIDYAETMDMQEIFRTAKESGAAIFKMTPTRRHYKNYIDRTLFNFDMGKDISSNLTLTTMYFLLLSEIFRKKYL